MRKLPQADELPHADEGYDPARVEEAFATFADRVRNKTVDDLLDDGRDFVKKSPTVAIAAAAVAGFALIRVIRTGLDDAGGSRGKSGGRKRTRSNTDTTAGGGA